MNPTIAGLEQWKWQDSKSLKSSSTDHIGAFVVGIHGADEWAAQLREKHEVDSAIMVQAIADRLAAETAAQLKALLGRHPGSCAVTVRAVLPEESETTLRVPLKVAPTDELLEAARRLGFEVELR